MLKQVKSKVLNKLQTYNSTKDNDNLLIAMVLSEECFEQRITTLEDFFVKFSNGKFSSAESIRRTRQKLQQDNKELRGESYYQRKHKQQGVIQELKEM